MTNLYLGDCLEKMKNYKSFISNTCGALTFGIYNQYLAIQQNLEEYKGHNKTIDEIIKKNNQILYKNLQLIK